jgi:hypothetical protein
VFPVQIVAIGTGVRITVRGRSRDLELGARTGDDAARLVALAAADLMLPELALSPTEVHVERAADEPAATEPAAVPSWSIALMGTGAAWSGVIDGGGSVGFVGPVGDALVTAELGLGTLVGGDLYGTTQLVRAGLAKRLGVLEARAALTLVPLHVTDGSGDDTVLVGAGASVRLRMPVARSVRAVVALGADAYATRTEYTRGGMPATTTPLIAPYLSAGLEVTR